MSSTLPLELRSNHVIHVLGNRYLALTLVKLVKDILNFIHILDALIFQHSDQLKSFKKPILVLVDDFEALYDLIE